MNSRVVHRSNTVAGSPSRIQPPSSPATRQKSNVVPTNTVTTRDGHTARARIDPTLPVADVVRQLCLNLKVSEHPALCALRDDQDELVTDENLRKKIIDKAHLRLVNSPLLEAVDIVEKLSGRDDKALKLALFSLQKYIQEEQFSHEFLKRGGLAELLRVITYSHGNTLAYALKALQNLMSLDYGWSNLPTSFISRIIQILSNPQNLSNVCRPATAILNKLVEADPRAAPGPAVPVASSSKAKNGGSPAQAPGSVWRYGFDLVFEEMRADGEGGKLKEGEGGIRMLDTVVQRLASGDSIMALNSMLLLNSLLKNATDNYWEELSKELERLNVRKAVVRLTALNTMEDLTSSILEFQANLMSLAYRRKTTPVDPNSWTVRRTLDYIWRSARLSKDPSTPRSHQTGGPKYSISGSTRSRYQSEQNDHTYSGPPRKDSLGILGSGSRNGSLSSRGGAWDEFGLEDQSLYNNNGSMTGFDDDKWVKLGFESEDIRAEFGRTGLLGLDCLRTFIRSDPDYFADAVLEQLSRPPERRCPVATASNEVVELLSEHWAIFAPGYSTASSFQPYFLSLDRIHSLALKFFLRIWNESSASIADFARVAALVQSQIKVVLKDESRPWHEVEHDFLESEYRDVRERQLRELELEDDLLNKPPVRNLRAKLYKESFEFVRNQRIQCLMQGAWFVNGHPVSPSGAPSSPSRDSIALKRMPRPWKFFRLDKSMRYLHFVDSVVKIPIRSGLEDLPEKIDMSHILDVVTGTCALPPNILPNGTSPPDVPGASQVASPLSFSLISSRGGGSSTIADIVAENSTSFCDWIDGFNMLRRDHFTTKETAEFVQTLTEIGLKIKLLDLSGERVEIPNSFAPPPLPPSVDFFFADFV